MAQRYDTETYGSGFCRPCVKHAGGGGGGGGKATQLDICCVLIGRLVFSVVWGGRAGGVCCGVRLTHWRGSTYSNFAPLGAKKR
ncbi:unnamed protein product [Ectocarpus sp. CCAP 1310/34]|nr:unnamed protein product [Ectocarpus sp. CCAP 1310/34]